MPPSLSARGDPRTKDRLRVVGPAGLQPAPPPRFRPTRELALRAILCDLRPPSATPGLAPGGDGTQDRLDYERVWSTVCIRFERRTGFQHRRGGHLGQLSDTAIDATFWSEQSRETLLEGGSCSRTEDHLQPGKGRTRSRLASPRSSCSWNRPAGTPARETTESPPHLQEAEGSLDYFECRWITGRLRLQQGALLGTRVFGVTRPGTRWLTGVVWPVRRRVGVAHIRRHVAKPRSMCPARLLRGQGWSASP